MHSQIIRSAFPFHACMFSLSFTLCELCFNDVQTGGQLDTWTAAQLDRHCIDHLFQPTDRSQLKLWTLLEFWARN